MQLHVKLIAFCCAIIYSNCRVINEFYNLSDDLAYLMCVLFGSISISNFFSNKMKFNLDIWGRQTSSKKHFDKPPCRIYNYTVAVFIGTITRH